MPGAAAVAPAVRGVCPTAHRPFVAADGVLLRVRPPIGEVTPSQLATLAAAATEAGARAVELTGRANLQVRGVPEPAFDGLLAALVAAELVDPDPEVDARRPLLPAPATGLDPTEIADVRPLAGSTLSRLAAPGAPALRPKAAVVLDAGGGVSLRGRPADVALGLVRRSRGAGRRPAVAYEVVLAGPLPVAADGPSLVLAPRDVPAFTAAVFALAAEAADGGSPVPVRDLVEDAGHEALVRAAAERAGSTVEVVDTAELSRAEPDGTVPLGLLPDLGAVGAAPLLGRLTPDTLARLARVLTDHGVESVRLTPWRTVLVPTDKDRARLRDELADLGLVTDPADPALAVVACSGSAGCPSGLADTQADAKALIRRLRAAKAAGVAATPPSSIHLSGCTKRCASRRTHALTLVATAPGRYDAHVADPARGPGAERLAAVDVAPEEVAGP